MSRLREKYDEEHQPKEKTIGGMKSVDPNQYKGFFDHVKKMPIEPNEMLIIEGLKIAEPHIPKEYVETY